MKTILTSIIAIILFTTIGCVKEETKQEPIVQAETITQNYITKKPELVNYSNEIKTTGFVSNKNEYQLSFMVGGIINYLSVDEGDYVKKGQLIAKINQTSVNVMTDRLNLAYDKAKRDYARVEALYKDHVVTLENLQNAKTGLENIRLQLENAKFSKQHATITAPNSGRIISVLAQKNEMARAGSPIVIMGSNQGGKVLNTNLADIDIVKVKKKDPCSIQFDAFPNKTFDGYVDRISSSADRYTGTYEIEIQIKDPGNQLKSGFIGKATIQSKIKKEYLQIPIEALISADKMIGKINILEGGEKKQRTIKIAKILGEKLLVLNGISENDTIILN